MISVALLGERSVSVAHLASRFLSATSASVDARELGLGSAAVAHCAAAGHPAVSPAAASVAVRRGGGDSECRTACHQERRGSGLVGGCSSRKNSHSQARQEEAPGGEAEQLYVMVLRTFRGVSDTLCWC